MLIKQKKELWMLFSVSHKIRIIRLLFLMTMGMILEIIVAHQLSMAENCDVIVKLNKGKIESIGATKEILG